MTISVVFDPPLLSDSPAVFNSKAFTLVGDLNNWSNEANALASDVTSKQTTASNAATTATNQADLANSSRIAAQDAAAAAAASYDSFDDRYLGAKASDPTLDNDGNALIEGALYWNSTAKETRTWNGTTWVTTSVANAVSRGGDTMTGPLSVPAGASGAQVPQAQEALLKAGNLSGLANAATARTNLGLGSAATRAALGTTGSLYSRDSILGSVAQSGGVPTGAIIEKGSNANGAFTRFADGTQICWRDVALGTTANALNTLFTTASVSGSWAANFSATPYVVASAKNSSGAVVWTANMAASTTGFSLLQGVSVVNTATADADLVAVGRWF